MNDARPGPRRAAAVALAAVAVLVLAGCNDDAEPQQGSRPVEPSPSATTTAGASASATQGSPGASGSATGAPRIELLGAGSGPKRRLTLDLEEGHRETSSMRLVMRMELGPSGSVEVPYSMPLATTVTEASDEGYAVTSVVGKPVVDAAKIAGGLGPTLQQTLALIEGTSMHVGFGPNGAVTSSTVEVPDGVPDVVARMMDSFSSQANGLAVPFPDEEVGVGARWRTVSTVRLSGTTVTVSATYRLTELRDDGYALTLAIAQRTHPGAVAGGASIVKGSSTGTGTITGRDGFVMPVEAVSDVDGSSVVEVGGQKVRTAFGARMDLTTR
ncbi:hypothetical protein [Nocardioides sp. LML1-1-1.1]|uniref:hypothetical protein n=1 Tax=Nocardioides sp. LML1-1-1.1 TaxID=3135248 RepID=UPI003433BAC3